MFLAYRRKLAKRVFDEKEAKLGVMLAARSVYRRGMHVKCRICGLPTCAMIIILETSHVV